MPDSSPSICTEATRFSQRWLDAIRCYWLAGVLLLVGLAGTGWVGRQVSHWAQARDTERFQTECRMIVGMIEQKMERYETALGRIRDVCARDHGEVSSANWNGWLVQTLAMADNYPNALCLVVAPKVPRKQRAAFELRAKAQVNEHPGNITTSRSEAKYWCPVWRRSARAGLVSPILGDDLLAETATHPSFEPALARRFGWVTEWPARLSQGDGTAVTGFWYVLPLRPLDFTNRIQWERLHETGNEAALRRQRLLSQRATGLLATFIGGDQFLNQFNAGTNLVRVQVFTATEPSPEMLLNPGQPPPANARFVHDDIRHWYGRRWLARFTSTPVFEAGSLRYRAALVWWMGIPLSLAGSGAVAWQTRGRLREAALAAQLRQALGRQERLSRDLHDGTLQSVYGVGLGLQRAQRLLEKRPDDAANQLGDSTRALQRVVGELRDFIRESDPTTREEIRLGQALAGVIAHLKLATEIEMELVVAPGADDGLTPAQSLQLLNIAREALINAVRHSQAHGVRIALAWTDGTLRLEVADDGCGFDMTAALETGHGLHNLAARVRELGGAHRWETASGRGTRLVVEIPTRANQPTA